MDSNVIIVSKHTPQAQVTVAGGDEWQDLTIVSTLRHTVLHTTFKNWQIKKQELTSDFSVCSKVDDSVCTSLSITVFGNLLSNSLKIGQFDIPACSFTSAIFPLSALYRQMRA